MKNLFLIILLLSVCFAGQKTDSMFVTKYLSTPYIVSDSAIFGKLKITDTTTSISKSSGALIVNGGIGVYKRSHFGGDSVVFGEGNSRVNIDTVGGLVLAGDATQWDDVDDINLNEIARPGDAGEPKDTATGLGFNMNIWEVNDSAEGSNEIYHKFKQQDSIEFHVHYHTNGTDGTARYTKWTMKYWIFNNLDSTTYYGELTKEDTIPANTKHMTQRIISFGKYAIPNQGIGARCFAKLIRIVASGTAPTKNPYVDAIGMHMRVDMLGSRQTYIK